MASGKTCAIAPFSAFESSVSNTQEPASPRPPKASFFNKDCKDWSEEIITIKLVRGLVDPKKVVYYCEELKKILVTY